MSYTTPKLVLDGKKLTAYVDAICKDSEKMQIRIDTALRSVAIHVMLHGNINVVNNLVNRLVKSTELLTHDNAVRRWFNEHCKAVVWNNKTKEFDFNSDLVAKIKASEESIENYKAHYAGPYDPKKGLGVPPYYSMTKPKEFNGQTIAAVVLGALSRVAKTTNSIVQGDRPLLEDDDFTKYKQLASFAATFDAKKAHELETKIASNLEKIKAGNITKKSIDDVAPEVVEEVKERTTKRRTTAAKKAA